MNESAIKLTEEQEYAVSVMMSGRNVFLTGEAGTGKSTVLQEFRRRCDRPCVVLAPTGIAAINAGGTTIHSFFQLRPGLLTPDTIEPFTSGSRAQVIREARTIVIDEVSMVRSDLLSAIDIRLRALTGGPKRQMPFGGKQIVLVGDFFQLPPVVKPGIESDYLNQRLGGSFAFQTDLWAAAQFSCVFLRQVHRQGGDARFMAVLNDLRNGKFAEAAEVLNGLCLRERQRKVPPVCLCTTNREAREVNVRASVCGNGASRTFNAVVKGQFPEGNYPTELSLEVRVGNRVMLLCNCRKKDGEFDYVNGDLGVVTRFVGEGDDAAVVLRLDSGREVTVESNEWKSFSYVSAEDPVSHKRVVRQHEVGSFTQMPLRLAYAVTIHKSQGLSLDSVDLNLGCGCFSHGQLYTALSRCRSLAGLRIDRAVRPEDLIIDQAVIDFYAEMVGRDLRARRNAKKTQNSLEDRCGPPRTSDPTDPPPYYEEAMQYYLHQLDPHYAPDAGSVRQFEFCFDQRVYAHPDLEKLKVVYRSCGFNKYDAPALNPIAESYCFGNGVTETELVRVSRIIAKY